MVDDEGFGRRGRPTPRPFTVFDFIAPVVAPVKVRNRWKAFQAEDVEDKQFEDYGDERPLDNGNRQQRDKQYNSDALEEVLMPGLIIKATPR